MFVFGVFLVRIFLPLDLIQKDTECLSIFRPNARKYRPEKLQIRALFTQCMPLIYNAAWKNNLTMKLLHRLKRKTVLLNISVIKEAV